MLTELVIQQPAYVLGCLPITWEDLATKPVGHVFDGSTSSSLWVMTETAKIVFRDNQAVTLLVSYSYQDDRRYDAPELKLVVLVFKM